MSRLLINFLTIVLLLGGVIFADTPIQIMTANVWAKGFTVVWYSSSNEVGFVKSGTAPSNMTVFNDVRGSVSSRLHMVDVTGDVNTGYVFSVHSGSVTDNNIGAFYVCRTAPDDMFYAPYATTFIKNVYPVESSTRNITSGDVFVMGRIRNTLSGELSALRVFRYDFVDQWKNQFVYGYFRDVNGNFVNYSPANLLQFESWYTDGVPQGFGGQRSVQFINGVTSDIFLDQLMLSSSSNTHTRPLDVTGVTLSVGFNFMTLGWVPSVSTSSVSTAISRKTTGFPSSFFDNDGWTFVGSANSVVDNSVVDGQTYYYTVYSLDSSGYYSTGVTISAIAVGSKTPQGVVFADFNSGTAFDNWGGPIYGYSWPSGYSSSLLTLLGSGVNGTLYCGQLSYSLASQNTGAGIELNLNAARTTMNISNYTGVEFYLKGDGHGLSLELNSTLNVSPNLYAYNLGNTPLAWTKITIPFTSFSQPSWGPTVSLTAVLQNLIKLQFKTGSNTNESGSFSIDEVKFLTQNLVPPLPATGLSFNEINDNLSTFDVRVAWVNPTANYFKTLVVRRTDRYSISPTDGVNVFYGSANQVLDASLLKDVWYYYTLFVYDEFGNLSSPANNRFIVYLHGGTAQSEVYISDNIYIGVSPNLKLLQPNDYIDSLVTLTIPVMTRTISLNAVATLSLTGTLTKTVTFNPSASTNYVVMPLVITSSVAVLTFEAIDWEDSHSSQNQLVLRVAASSDALALKAGSAILPYPSPYNPDAGKLTIAYELIKAGSLDVYVYNIAGKLLNRFNYPANTEGGRAGYNEIAFSGVDVFGQTWSNGVYILRLVCDKRVVGSSKILVIR